MIIETEKLEKKLCNTLQHQYVEIGQIACSAEINCRLASLGILPKQLVEVIRITKRGAVLIKVNEMLLALSTGIAQQIYVKDISNDD